MSETQRLSIQEQLEIFQRSDAQGGSADRHAQALGTAAAASAAAAAPAAATFAPFSGPAEYAFPPGLSNHDRAVVHAECKKYGFSSKSHG